jgi:hypothetical protein
VSEQVFIEVSHSNTNRRGSDLPERTWELLADSKPIVESAIGEGIDLALAATSSADSRDGWQFSEIELAFGIKLSAEAGFIVSSVGGEASIEVRIRVSRV